MSTTETSTGREVDDAHSLRKRGLGEHYSTNKEMFLISPLE